MVISEQSRLETAFLQLFQAFDDDEFRSRILRRLCEDHGCYRDDRGDSLGSVGSDDPRDCEHCGPEASDAPNLQDLLDRLKADGKDDAYRVRASILYVLHKESRDMQWMEIYRQLKGYFVVKKRGKIVTDGNLKQYMKAMVSLALIAYNDRGTDQLVVLTSTGRAAAARLAGGELPDLVKEGSVKGG